MKKSHIIFNHTFPIMRQLSTYFLPCCDQIIMQLHVDSASDTRVCLCVCFVSVVHFLYMHCSKQVEMSVTHAVDCSNSSLCGEDPLVQ